MRLDQINRVYGDYEVAFRHNPSHFYPNSFQVEREERRLIVVAVVKKHIGKRFRVVGVLRRRVRAT